MHPDDHRLTIAPQPVYQRHGPERPIAREPFRGERGQQFIELRLIARGRKGVLIDVVGDPKTHVGHPERTSAMATQRFDPLSCPREVAEIAGYQRAQFGESHRCATVRRVQNRDLQGVHRRRRGLHVEHQRVRSGHALHRTTSPPSSSVGPSWTVTVAPRRRIRPTARRQQTDPQRQWDLPDRSPPAARQAPPRAHR